MDLATSNNDGSAASYGQLHLHNIMLEYLTACLAQGRESVRKTCASSMNGPSEAQAPSTQKVRRTSSPTAEDASEQLNNEGLHPCKKKVREQA